MKTIIYGQARSGTTALFLRLQAAMPSTTTCLFEPDSLLDSSTQMSQDILVKALVMTLPGDERRASSIDPTLFDRRLVLVRDPRDRLVSLLLFLLHWHTTTYPPLEKTAPIALDTILHLLRRKEQDPTSVSMVRLFEMILWTRFGLDMYQAPQTYARLQAAFLCWHQTLENSETIRYEMRAAGASAPCPRRYASIRRTATVGEWRHWFTPADVGYFRPLMWPYMQRYTYPDDWVLPSEPYIDPAGSSQYVEKWIRVKRRAAHVAATP